MLAYTFPQQLLSGSGVCLPCCLLLPSVLFSGDKRVLATSVPGSLPVAPVEGALPKHICVGVEEKLLFLFVSLSLQALSLCFLACPVPLHGQEILGRLLPFASAFCLVRSMPRHTCSPAPLLGQKFSLAGSPGEGLESLKDFMQNTPRLILLATDIKS